MATREMAERVFAFTRSLNVKLTPVLQQKVEKKAVVQDRRVVKREQQAASIDPTRIKIDATGEQITLRAAIIKLKADYHGGGWS